MESLSGHLGCTVGHLGVTLWSLCGHSVVTVSVVTLWNHYLVTLGSHCNDFDIILESLWERIGDIMGPLWKSLGAFGNNFGSILGSLWDQFGITLDSCLGGDLRRVILAQAPC